MLIFRIGNNDRPATPADIKDFRKKYEKAGRAGEYLVSHHAFDCISFPDNLNNENIVFRIGNADRPASQDDIEDFCREMEEAKKKDGVIYTHHPVDFIVVPRTSAQKKTLEAHQGRARQSSRRRS